MQHGGDLLVAQAIRRLDVDARFHTADLFFGPDAQQAIGIDRECHADAGCPSRHGRNATQLKASQAAAVLHQIAFTLHHMQRQRGLAVLVGGEVLRHGGRNGLVARDDALDQTAHGFDAQRQRNHIEQQQFTRLVVARQLVGLDGRPQRHDFIGVEVVQWRLPKEIGHGLLNLRHAGGAPHHDHALHIVFGQLGIAQRLARRRDAAGCQGLGGLFKVNSTERPRQNACGQGQIQGHGLGSGQRFLGRTGCGLEPGFVFGGHRLQSRMPCHGGIGQGLVVIVTPQSRVTACGQHLEHALCQAQDRNVKRATAQIEHGVNAFAGVVQPVGNGSRRGFVDQAQHVQPRQLRSVFGGLALGVVKVSGHGDDRAVQVVVEGVFGAVTQRGQNFGADFHGRLGALHRLDGQHAPLVSAFTGGERIGQFAAVRNVVQAPAHQALDRSDGVDRIGGRRLHRIKTDLAALARHETHDGGQDHPAMVIGQALGHPVAHRGHQRMCGAQVDAYGNAALVGIGRLARFRNLQ